MSEEEIIEKTKSFVKEKCQNENKRKEAIA